ncbi:tRNA(His) guanylyltransferase Thg1 family protein [Oribacterium sp. P6A1]|uniref:tRNA(His) guanylyltransferase Thg1 family protein n=1 Tax=Oribacterium sp. P6A1 TaxID=1410612 RepID=UPI00056D2748|nr:tRNA(His) guanylyltransferase Thg1 family protein [Oribacterium sp. P6A1]
MRFDEMDVKMRVYEQSLDQVLLPDIYMVARLDGRGFTRLTKEVCHFEAPFDEKFRNMMVKTTKVLMDCGFRVVYAYTESDEISLLFSADEVTFGRKVRKYNSTLAAEASAVFSLELGMAATFDCRMVPLPNAQRVEDYFRWRQEDANRNALNSHCYWMLRKEGVSVHKVTSELKGKGVSFKKELLCSRGINYDNLPSWQKHGVGMWMEEYEKEGLNPLTGEVKMTTRNRVHVEYELPLGDEYGKLIRKFT